MTTNDNGFIRSFHYEIIYVIGFKYIKLSQKSVSSIINLELCIYT